MPFTSASLRQTYHLVQGLQAATFNSRNADGVAFTSYALNLVKKKPNDNDEDLLRAGGVLNVTTCVWQLWQDDLDNVSAPSPKPDDEIVDGADVWVFTKVRNKLLGNCYECVAQKVPA